MRYNNKGLINDLSTSNYIRDGLNIILIGASGCGKTWLSSTFGINACRARFRVKYMRLPEILSDFEISRIQDNCRKLTKQLSNYDLIIIDKFLLSTINEIEKNNLLELMKSRWNKHSTILCS